MTGTHLVDDDADNDDEDQSAYRAANDDVKRKLAVVTIAIVV